MTFTRTRMPRMAAWLRAEWRDHRLLYLAWLIWFVAFALLVRSTLGGPDGTRYLAYLRSLVFDRDLILTNELERFGQRVIITATGYSAQIANVGIIPFWLPFYLMGVVSAWLAGDVGSGLASNYQLWLDFGDWLYGLLAILVMVRWLRTRSSAGIATFAVLLAVLGSSYIYYMTALAPSYHMTTALLCAIFIAIWDRTRGNRSLAQWLALGLLAGTAMSIAQYHALLLVFPALETLAGAIAIGHEWRVSELRHVGSLLRQVTPRRIAAGLALVIGLMLPLAPQFVAWGIIFGNPFANPYTIDANWNAAHFSDVLFSSYHGLFFTAPLLLLACLGWFVGLRRDWPLYGGALLFLAGITYSSATRIGFWGGVSFGMRYAIGLTPLFALGLCVWLATVRTRPLHLAIAAIGVTCVLWTYGYFLQAFFGPASFSEYHAAAQWLANQWQIIRDPWPFLTRQFLLPRSPTLMANLAGLALISLVIWRAGAALIAAPRRAASGVLVLAVVPLVFAAGLLATVPNNEARMAVLRANGYYAKNSNRGEFDWEQFSNEYVERARYYDAIGQHTLAMRDIARAFEIWPNKSRVLSSGDVTGRFRPVGITFGDEVELVAYQTQPDVITAGQPLTVTLLWRAGKRLPSDYDSGVLLIDANGQVSQRSPSGQGDDAFPASWWLPGTLIADRQVIDVSAVAPATLLKLRAELFDPFANKRLAAPANGVFAEIKRPPLPGGPASVVGTLGGAVSLIGSQFARTASGATLAVTWRADAPLERDYTVFVHLLDAQNAIIAQHDAQPLKGRYPTHAWAPGDVINETYDFALTPTQQERVQSAVVGLYTLSDGRRLPASGGGDLLRIPLR
ncbi:MAG: hypothetical protein HZB53_14480 [Chloroflexi bacterium]|nr:hypothetical protein [Chloroflexota bacterium]